MQPQIVEITERKLVGMKITTSLSENRTFELWSRFKPRVKEINHRKNNDFYSVQIYKGELNYQEFTPFTTFEKWAAVEVSEFNVIPQDFDFQTLTGGKYAVFMLRGTHSEAVKTIQNVFQNWLPNSEFEFDNREQFEIMGEKYISPNDENSEEEIWIPIKLKL
jgi:AraC family transcriptional regulator